MAIMSTKPWLSVLIPTYNGEDYLSFALNSIVAQKDSKIECIAIDDGSTDATIPILKSYQDKLPLIILQRERQGNWVSNTNYALTFANGEYVCFLHQDDLWLKNRLSTMKTLIKQFPDTALFLHSSYYLDIRGNQLGVWRCPLPISPKTIEPDLMIEKLLIQNFISIPSPIFKRDMALKVNGLDETLWYTADWDFWLKIVALGNTLYHPSPLSGFRVHPSSQTVTRSSYLSDFRKQLEHVTDKHFAIWGASEPRKKRIRNIADFSIEVNTTLAGTLHDHNVYLFKLFIYFLLLGPMGGCQYLKDSRILERTSARLKAQLATKSGSSS